ncbi:MAG: dihydropteroate synthase [Bryobacterales bacterium]|nr:dihydropteroate synthase [Bryobacterales bacterium]
MPVQIMGVLNVTPDSFSDGGRFFQLEAALQQARHLIEEGADILDIGGESTRPGAGSVSTTEELRRVLPVIEALGHESAIRLSIDTRKPEVADAALRAGATLINDVTGLSDPAMAAVAARHHAGVVIMHMRGTPETMRGLTEYTDVVAEVKAYLATQAAAARAAGIDEIILDPGIGFAKTAAQSLTLLRHLGKFQDLGYPILIGPSRKSFLSSIAGLERPEDRLEGTLAAVAIGVLHGASIVRVHDVAACRKAALVAAAIRSS